MNRVLARLVGFAAAGLLAFPLGAAAQMTRGAISGTVRDAQGAVVPGATVTVTNVATNSTRSTVSDAQGFYRVPALEPGTYNVKTDLSGFQSVENKDLRLVAASEITLNVDMKVAGVGEAITVLGKSEAIELNKTSAVVGTTTMARQVVELPLAANRDINNLIAVGPNVVAHGRPGHVRRGRAALAQQQLHDRRLRQQRHLASRSRRRRSCRRPWPSSRC